MDRIKANPSILDLVSDHATAYPLAAFIAGFVILAAITYQMKG